MRLTVIHAARRVLSVLWWSFVFPRVPGRWKLPIYYYYYRYKKVLEPELELLHHIVPRERTAVDIGANLGLYVFRLTRLCTRVEAYEPNPACVDILRAYRHPHLKVHALALSAEPGTADLHVPSVNGRELPGLASLGVLQVGNSIRNVRVQLDTLDNQALPDVGFIKIDVEGHESEVIAGAARTLEKHRPRLLVEIEQRHLRDPIQNVFHLIESKSYDGYFLQSSRFHRLSAFELDHHQSVTAYAAIASGRREYINNFFFFPREDRELLDKLRTLGLLCE